MVDFPRKKRRKSIRTNMAIAQSLHKALLSSIDAYEDCDIPKFRDEFYKALCAVVEIMGEDWHEIEFKKESEHGGD